MAVLAQEVAHADSSQTLSEPEGWRWLTGDGTPVHDFSAILDAIGEAQESREEVEVHVGCDSARQVRQPTRPNLAP